MTSSCQVLPTRTRPGRQAIETVNLLARACRARSIPVIFTAQRHRSDRSDLGQVGQLHPVTAQGRALSEGTAGADLHQALEVKGSDYVIVKRRFSAFYSTDLDVLLRGLGVQLLLIAGVALNVCCESTIRDAFFRDYEVILISDATGAASLADRGWGEFDEDAAKRYTLTLVSTFFGEVAPSAEVLRRIEAAP